ncbi:ABC transporter permease [Desertimonas flava]|uniref:ABC transporter permease n=1 Tax=Desertimonas flava TaxID=2064846 RepID=UPI000E34909B|nr:ABC transporter permease [Desertimonas flava]
MRFVRLFSRRLLTLVPVLFGVSLATFFLIDLVPGDPAAIVLGANATPEQLEIVRDELNLDQPAPQRYISWLSGALTGDLGRSYVPPEQSVAEAIASRLPVTFELAIAAMLIATLVSIPLGLLAALREGEPMDAFVNAVVIITVSIAAFLMGLLLIYAFVLHADGTRTATLVGGLLIAAGLAATALRERRRPRTDRAPRTRSRLVSGAVVLAATLILWRFWPQLPRQGFSRLTAERGVLENLRSVALPAMTLALVEIPVLTTAVRSDAIATLQQDYVRFARSRGLSTGYIMRRHVLKPSMMTFLAIAGVSVGRLLGGAVIVETIFGLPGMGSLIVNAVANKDFRMVQGAVLVVAAFYVAMNAVVDAAARYIDPRISDG